MGLQIPLATQMDWVCGEGSLRSRTPPVTLPRPNLGETHYPRPGPSACANWPPGPPIPVRSLCPRNGGLIRRSDCVCVESTRFTPRQRKTMEQTRVGTARRSPDARRSGGNVMQDCRRTLCFVPLKGVDVVDFGAGRHDSEFLQQAGAQVVDPAVQERTLFAAPGALYD